MGEGCGVGATARSLPDGTYPASGLHAAQETGAVGEPGAEGSRVAGVRRTDGASRGSHSGVRGGVGGSRKKDANPDEGHGGGGVGGTEPDGVGRQGMIQITPQMRILVAIEAVDGRKGIDSLARLCQEKLQADPFSGCLVFFRSRRGTSIRILVYDGQGFWLAQKRLSKGRFVWWPSGNEPTRVLEAHQAQTLLSAGNPDAIAAPVWRRVSA